MGDKFSPCLTPMLHWKYSVVPQCVITLDFMSLHKFWIRLKHFPLNPCNLKFCHNPRCQTVSKACLKSTKQQYNVLCCDCKISIKDFKINRISEVEWFFINPAWQRFIVLCSSEYLFSRLFIVEVNRFRSSLTSNGTVILRSFWVTFILCILVW